VLPENRVILDANDVIHILGVVISQIRQDVELHTCLVMEALFIPDYLHGHMLVGLVVEAFQSLTEAPLPNEFLHLVAIANVIFQYHLVVALIIVIAIVEFMVCITLHFRGI
jgi:hypothetical protein